MLKIKYRTRIYYTETDNALMWDRWRRGDSLHTRRRPFMTELGCRVVLSERLFSRNEPTNLATSR